MLFAGRPCQPNPRLGQRLLIGSVSYTLEDVEINLNPGFFGPTLVSAPGRDRWCWRPLGFPPVGPGGAGGPPTRYPRPTFLMRSWPSMAGVSFRGLASSLAYDTRNSVQFPNKGQRTEMDAEFVGGPLGGDRNFANLELKTGWYFKGFAKGHVLDWWAYRRRQEPQSGDVPFEDATILAGWDSLRGFKFYSISPRQPGFNEPIGGDTYWFRIGRIQHSHHRAGARHRGRFAVFYDVGNVAARPWTWIKENFDDNWGVGLRLNLPIGPRRSASLRHSYSSRSV